MSNVTVCVCVQRGMMSTTLVRVLDSHLFVMISSQSAYPLPRLHVDRARGSRCFFILHAGNLFGPAAKLVLIVIGPSTFFRSKTIERFLRMRRVCDVLPYQQCLADISSRVL
ncbi:hypothetical protein H310_05621 [Aphanomyces invadans]|uniref:Uncharacterized protein n=1 Tax=Aphanomyces invadans TaxID=157072 RepID=A0A024UBE0_9STRA|nr:hypothetical protein H310_05621 [Aphanomyces invadans]ETW03217.1 hypothetical protein H310_05621 [Aphanomyces invadans]|eukprot:XP_008868601.1 hypothetical protein H310_05621 [Aphanomyces invadans]